MSRWFLTFALIISLVPGAHARTVRARIQGPARDGVTYAVHASSVDSDTPLEPWALAEGVVDGEHRSVLLRLEPTSRRGDYRFTRAWPNEGRWTLRLCLGNPAAPATVVALRPDGRVGRQTFHFHTDGLKECLRLLGYAPGRDC